MARSVLPLFGPSAPMMSISFGLAVLLTLTVPLSALSPTVTVYVSSLPMTSFMDLRISSGNGLPLISAVSGIQVPARGLFLPVSVPAAKAKDARMVNAIKSVRIIRVSVGGVFKLYELEIGRPRRVRHGSQSNVWIRLILQ